MILLKACPRCGGDVDATWSEDVYCIQCSYRPRTAVPAPFIVENRPDMSEPEQQGKDARVGGDGRSGEVGESAIRRARPRLVCMCPRCDTDELVRLDRLRERDNLCYRCRTCGHIFSPASSQVPPREERMM